MPVTGRVPDADQCRHRVPPLAQAHGAVEPAPTVAPVGHEAAGRVARDERRARAEIPDHRDGRHALPAPADLPRAAEATASVVGVEPEASVARSSREQVGIAVAVPVEAADDRVHHGPALADLPGCCPAVRRAGQEEEPTARVAPDEIAATVPVPVTGRDERAPGPARADGGRRLPPPAAGCPERDRPSLLDDELGQGVAREAPRGRPEGCRTLEGSRLRAELTEPRVQVRAGARRLADVPVADDGRHGAPVDARRPVRADAVERELPGDQSRHRVHRRGGDADLVVVPHEREAERVRVHA